jgi:cytochrome c
MFNRRTALLLAAIVIQGALMPAHAGEFGTREEAVAIAERVAASVAAQGTDATFKAITDKSKEFTDRDLYPFVYTMDGVNVAHGANSALVGKNLIGLKDQNGKFLIQEIVTVAKSEKPGWVDYKWPNPINKKIEDKSAYVIKVGDYAVGVGVYR